MTIENMRVFVFSYNRGKYLKNCLDSLERNAQKYPITVIDDGSEDPHVWDTLHDRRNNIDVVVNNVSGNSYLGGLYRNMQYAIDTYRDTGMALFIQDDQQVLRPLKKQDEESWKAFFYANPGAHELITTFPKKDSVADTDGLIVDEKNNLYWRDPHKSNRAFFTATGVLNIEKMRQDGWRFLPTEGENNIQAEELGYKLAMSPYPLMMWLPNAESSKFRKKGFSHKIAEWYRRVGFYPYEQLGKETLTWLEQRPIHEVPYAQDVLQPRGFPEGRQWLFEDATKSVRWIHRRLKKKKKKMAEKERGGDL